MVRSSVAAWIVALCLGGMAAPAGAQDYPNRPIRMIVPFPPGGGTDLSGRIVAEYLSQRLGQPVVVENKAGAGSQIGMDLVAKAKPDGYTLVWGGSDGMSVIPALKATVSYRIPEDYEFIATAVKTAPVLSINPKLPYSTIHDVIAFGKANPGKVRYSSLGVGSSGHLASELLAMTTGIQMLHIPYSGTAPAIVAAVQGTVDVVFAGMGSVKTNLDAGTLRGLATADTVRSQYAPNVATFHELGIPMDVILYIGMLAPAGTPKPIVDRLIKEMSEMWNDPKVRDGFSKVGVEHKFLGGKDFEKAIVDDLERWKKVAKSANIVIND